MAYSIGRGVNDGSNSELDRKPIQNNRVFRNELSVARSRYIRMQIRKEEQEEKGARSRKKMLQKVGQDQPKFYHKHLISKKVHFYSNYHF